MKKTAKVLSALTALTAGAALAQSVSKPDPLDHAVRVPPVVYRSATSDYRAYRDPAIDDWRKTNAGVGKLGGHVGHVAPAGRSETPDPPGDSAAPSRAHPLRSGHESAR